MYYNCITLWKRHITIKSFGFPFKYQCINDGALRKVVEVVFLLFKALFVY